MNLQIYTDIANNKLKIITPEEEEKTLNLDEVSFISDFEELDNYIYLGNIKESGANDGYTIKILAVKNKQSNQIYFLEDKFFYNSFAYCKGSYGWILNCLMIITDKSLPNSIDSIKSIREGIQNLSEKLSLKDIDIYPSESKWLYELNVDLKLLFAKYSIYPKISDTIVGLIEKLDIQSQKSLLVFHGIFKKEIDERHFKIHINKDSVYFTFFNYSKCTTLPIDEKSAIKYLLKYICYESNNIFSNASFIP